MSSTTARADVAERLVDRVGRVVSNETVTFTSRILSLLVAFALAIAPLHALAMKDRSSTLNIGGVEISICTSGGAADDSGNGVAAKGCDACVTCQALAVPIHSPTLVTVDSRLESNLLFVPLLGNVRDFLRSAERQRGPPLL